LFFSWLIYHTLSPIIILLGQWLNFKLFGITYLVGKISRSNGFILGFHSLSELCFSGSKTRPKMKASSYWRLEIHPLFHRNHGAMGGKSGVFYPCCQVAKVTPPPNATFTPQEIRSFLKGLFKTIGFNLIRPYLGAYFLGGYGIGGGPLRFP